MAFLEDQLWAAEKGRVGLAFGALEGQTDEITVPGSPCDPRDLRPSRCHRPCCRVAPGCGEYVPRILEHVGTSVFPKGEPSASHTDGG